MYAYYMILMLGLIAFSGCQPSVEKHKNTSSNTQHSHQYIVKDQIIVDTIHHLMWENDRDVLKRGYKVSKESCENLFLKGFDDWRLPTAEEVVSILDYSHDRNLYPIDAFDYRLDCHEDGTCDSYIWTSSKARIVGGFDKGKKSPVQINIFDGTMYVGLKAQSDDKAYSKCVRSYKTYTK